MVLGRFNHDMHRNGLTCLDCHNVMNSELTSDLNLPGVKSCIECHGPKGGIDNSCMRCHTYHNSPVGSPVMKWTGTPIGPGHAEPVK